MRRKPKKDVLLLLNGEIGSVAELKRLARRCGTVLCADGGVRHAAEMGVAPRAVIGDMDSLPKRLPRWTTTIYVCDFDPDASDFEKSLRFIARQRFRRAAKRILGPASDPIIWIAGSLGGRLDHERVNWALLERYSASLRLHLAEGGAWIAGKGRHRIESPKGRTVTLLPVTPAARLTTHGLLYPLRKEVLERSSRGLSNRTVSSKAWIDVHEGRVWILKS